MLINKFKKIFNKLFKGTEYVRDPSDVGIDPLGKQLEPLVTELLEYFHPMQHPHRILAVSNEDEYSVIVFYRNLCNPSEEFCFDKLFIKVARLSIDPCDYKLKMFRICKTDNMVNLTPTTCGLDCLDGI